MGECTGPVRKVPYFVLMKKYKKVADKAGRLGEER